MAFRKNLFALLAFLSLAFMCYGVVGSTALVNEIAQTEVPGTENLTQQEAEDARNAGAVIGAGITSTVSVCIGLPFFLIFALLAWRNSAGLKTERRHQELLAAQKQA